MNKKICTGLLGIALLVVVVGVCFTRNKESEWQDVDTVSDCNTILEAEIEELTLRKSVDSAEWVVFEDEDLISEWQDFFSDLMLKSDNSLKKTASKLNGGTNVVSVKTNDKEIEVLFYDIDNNNVISINGNFYLWESTKDNSFLDIYDEAKERHGVVTPWE